MPFHIAKSRVLNKSRLTAIWGPDGLYGAAMTEARIPVAEVLAGMALHPLQDGWTPVEAFVVIKCLDAQGKSTWVYRTTSAPNREELLGALRVQAALLERELVDEYLVEDDE